MCKRINIWKAATTDPLYQQIWIIKMCIHIYRFTIKSLLQKYYSFMWCMWWWCCFFMYFVHKVLMASTHRGIRKVTFRMIYQAYNRILLWPPPSLLITYVHPKAWYIATTTTIYTLHTHTLYIIIICVASSFWHVVKYEIWEPDTFMIFAKFSQPSVKFSQISRKGFLLHLQIVRY